MDGKSLTVSCMQGSLSKAHFTAALVIGTCIHLTTFSIYCVTVTPARHALKLKRLDI